MLSIAVWLVGSYEMTSSEANIFDRKILKTGKTTPEARAAMVPTAKRGILSLE